MIRKKPIRYLEDIVELAGSTTKLAAALNLHAITVQGWRRCGIPRKYWDQLYTLYGASPAELFTVWKTCRKHTYGKDN